MIVYENGSLKSTEGDVANTLLKLVLKVLVHPSSKRLELELYDKLVILGLDYSRLRPEEIHRLTQVTAIRETEEPPWINIAGIPPRLAPRPVFKEDTVVDLSPDLEGDAYLLYRSFFWLATHPELEMKSYSNRMRWVGLYSPSTWGEENHNRLHEHFRRVIKSRQPRPLYQRGALFPIEWLLEKLQNPRYVRNSVPVQTCLGEQKVSVSSDRIRTYESGTRCVCCGALAEYVYIERDWAEVEKGSSVGWHINVYGTKDDKELMFTSDHFIPKSSGLDLAKERINRQVMCAPCSFAKRNKISVDFPL